MMDDAPWTLHDLADEVARVLRGYDPADNGQVRPVPDARSIRYYASLGLLDRPVATQGRTALYGRRHLAQLVAIKRLQAAGRSLAEVQAILPGLDDAALARASGVEVPRRPAPAAGRAGFWREAPRTGPASEKEIAPKRKAAPAQAFTERLLLELAPGVTVMVDPTRAPTIADADAARLAGQALVAELRRRRLVAPDGDRR